MQVARADGLARRAVVELFVVLALAVLALLWREGAAGVSGAVGVVLGVATGYVALWRKRRSLAESHQAALGAVLSVFFLRLALLVAGVVLVEKWQGSQLDFVGGFFLSFLAAQFIEVKYLVAASKAVSPRSE